MGCGTGRLLLDYLSLGIDVEGVDNSPEMLALCQQKAERMDLAPTLYLQAMEEMDLLRRYRTIIVPSSSFQLVLDPKLAGRAMKRFYEHLAPGGALAMPFMALWKQGEPVETDWRSTGEKIRPEDGAVVRRWSRSTYDVESGLESTEDRYEVTLEGQVIAAEHHRRSPATRSYTQPQAICLYEEAGFTNLQIYRGFSWEPASAGDTLFCIVGFRA